MCKFSEMYVVKEQNFFSWFFRFGIFYICSRVYCISWWYSSFSTVLLSINWDQTVFLLYCWFFWIKFQRKYLILFANTILKRFFRWLELVFFGWFRSLRFVSQQNQRFWHNERRERMVEGSSAMAIISLESLRFGVFQLKLNSETVGKVLWL